MEGSVTCKKPGDLVPGKAAPGEAQQGGLLIYINATVNICDISLNVSELSAISGYFLGTYGELRGAFIRFNAGGGGDDARGISRKSGGINNNCSQMAGIGTARDVCGQFDRGIGSLECSFALVSDRRRPTDTIQQCGIFRAGNDRRLPWADSIGKKAIAGYCRDHSQAPGGLSSHLLRQIRPQLSSGDDFDVDLRLKGNAPVAPVVKGLPGQTERLACLVNAAEVRKYLFECHTPALSTPMEARQGVWTIFFISLAA